MRLIISLSALLISVLFVQVGSGSLGPLDALSGLALGFSPTEIGYLGSAHFLGFFFGCIASPYLVVRAGHARVFAIMAAISTISITLHPVLEVPWFWMVLRVGSGFAVAGAYTVIESWLQSKLTNKNRGTVFSFYRMVDMSGTLLAQLVIAGLTPAHYISYNIIAVVACLALFPLALTQSTLPTIPETPSFRPFFIYSLSPLAAVGVIVTGLTNSSFRMVAPVYAEQIGLSQGGIAVFLALSVIGGLAGQLPAGMIADRLSRRMTLVGFSIFAMLVCTAISQDFELEIAGVPFIYCGSDLFGFATLPIYSICAAYASDYAKSDEFLEMSASLIFFYAIGAVVAPSFVGYLIETYGPSSMFSFIMMAHAFLLLYSIWRYFRRPVSDTPRPYRYIPRTTMFIVDMVRGKKKK